MSWSLSNPVNRKEVVPFTRNGRSVAHSPSRNKRETKLIDKNPWGDKDKDKVPNYFDCKPLNKKKQDKIQIFRDMYNKNFSKRGSFHPSLPDEIHVNYYEYHKEKPKMQKKIVAHELFHQQLEKKGLKSPSPYRYGNYSPYDAMTSFEKLKNYAKRISPKSYADSYGLNSLEFTTPEKEEELAIRIMTEHPKEVYASNKNTPAMIKTLKSINRGYRVYGDILKKHIPGTIYTKEEYTGNKDKPEPSSLKSLPSDDDFPQPSSSPSPNKGLMGDKRARFGRPKKTKEEKRILQEKAKAIINSLRKGVIPDKPEIIDVDSVFSKESIKKFLDANQPEPEIIKEDPILRMSFKRNKEDGITVQVSKLIDNIPFNYEDDLLPNKFKLKEPTSEEKEKSKFKTQDLAKRMAMESEKQHPPTLKESKVSTLLEQEYEAPEEDKKSLRERRKQIMKEVIPEELERIERFREIKERAQEIKEEKRREKELGLNAVQELKDQEPSQDVIEDLIEKAPKETKSFVAEALSSAESMPDIKESMEKSAERISKEE